MAGTYYAVGAPTVVAGFIVRPETKMLIGTQALYDSLEHTSFPYASYEVSIGLKSGQSFDVGQVGDLSWQHKPAYEVLEAFNIDDDSVWEVTGEETMCTVEIQQIDPRLLELAVGTGQMWSLGVERLIAFGGGCTLRNRPISLEWLNAGCNSPTSQDASAGITGGVLTLYDCFISSGLEWTMNAKEVNGIPIEFQARPILARPAGRRLGSLYLY
jgi:hypothetical protein